MSFRIPAIFGNTRTRDHFPFTTSNISAPMNTDTYPFKPGFQTLCKWLWRVKTWHITGSLGVMFHLISNNGHTVHGTLSATYDFLAPSLCTPPPVPSSVVQSTSEQNLISLVNGGFNFAANFNPAVSGTSYTGMGATFNPNFGSGHFNLSASCSGDWQIDTNNPAQPASLGGASVSVGFNLQPYNSINPIGWNATEGPAPSMDISTGILLQLNVPAPQHDTIIVQIAADASTFGGFFGSFLNTESPNILDTKHIPFYSVIHEQYHLFNNYVHGNDASIDSYTVGPVTIVAQEFWPYINSQGAPVYNTATGVELVDPFS